MVMYLCFITVIDGCDFIYYNELWYFGNALELYQTVLLCNGSLTFMILDSVSIVVVLQFCISEHDPLLCFKLVKDSRCMEIVHPSLPSIVQLTELKITKIKEIYLTK